MGKPTFNDIFRTATVTDLLKANDNAEQLVDDLLVHPTLVMLHADAGQMKSWLALALAHALAGAGSFLSHNVTKERKVLYLDSEMTDSSIGERLRCLKVPDQNLLYLLPEQEIDLSQDEHQNLLFKFLNDGGFKVLVWDNLRTSTLIDENSSSDFAKLNQFLRKLRNSGISVILLHHNNKSDDYAGSSNAKTVFDAVIGLKHHTDTEKQIEISKDRYQRLSHLNGSIFCINAAGYAELKSFTSDFDCKLASLAEQNIAGGRRLKTVTEVIAFLIENGKKMAGDSRKTEGIAAFFAEYGSSRYDNKDKLTAALAANRMMPEEDDSNAFSH